MDPTSPDTLTHAPEDSETVSDSASQSPDIGMFNSIQSSVTVVDSGQYLQRYENNHYADIPTSPTKGRPRRRSSVRGVASHHEGLCNVRAILFLLLWYFFSFCTLFLNKYILTTLQGDPTLLAVFQMLMTLTCGFIQMYLPCGMYTKVKREGKPPNFVRNMLLVGCTRFTTVVLGLVALKFVAVSFTETIKSSAPIFTVVIPRIMLGERTGLYVNLSLLPVMGGLALCSANELSFNFYGFVAALSTNITECLQNVYSKMLISGKKYRYTPAELQFYTSVASVLVQIPSCYFMVDFDKAARTDQLLLVAFLLNGIFFHFQSITAYALMDYISPVTHSVANTGKRAMLIWLSVLVFGNPVTFLSGAGTTIVLIGVLLYNKAREYDAAHPPVDPDALDVLNKAVVEPLLPLTKTLKEER